MEIFEFPSFFAAAAAATRDLATQRLNESVVNYFSSSTINFEKYLHKNSRSRVSKTLEKNSEIFTVVFNGFSLLSF